MSVSARILAAALLAAIVGFFAAALLVKVTVWRNNAGAALSLQSALSAQEVQRCQEHPETWTVELPSGARGYAYDARWGSANAQAPRIPLTESLVPGPLGAIARVPRGSQHGPIVAVRVAISGPCSLVAVHFNAPPQRQDPLLPGALALALVTAATAALGFLTIVRPLLQRIERLRFAAESVGQDSFSTGAGPSVRALAANDELDGIQRGLERAHARIVEANAEHAARLRTLEEHLANVAHDVRTPLASLQAQVEEALDADVSEEVRARLQGALEDCVYVGHLTEDLRLASRLQDGFDPRQGSTDLTAAVSRVVTRLQYFARRRGVTLEHATPEHAVMVRCDALAAEQAVGNIVVNAVTHLPTGGRVGVVLDASDLEGFTLTVVDDGEGVEPGALGRLGERTFRTDTARARDPRGSGLGLAISRAVCERVGFEIAFSAGEGGRGLAVVIRGPVAEGPARPSSPGD